MSMLFRTRSIAALALILLGCKPVPDQCTRRVRELRAHIAQIDWSVALVSDLFNSYPYESVPIAEGLQNQPKPNFGVPESVSIDGMNVRYMGEIHAFDNELSEWLSANAGILNRPNDANQKPVYILATASTPIAVVQAVAHALTPYLVPRLAFRPRSQLEPWQARKDQTGFYYQAIQQRPDEHFYTWSERRDNAARATAKGCPQATALVEDHTVHVEARLQRIPDVFEECKCAGDMDTLAALFWHQSFYLVRPMRWHPYDDKLLEQLGPDATYADLARVLTQRHRAGSSGQ
jgi:hypothetical protein